MIDKDAIARTRIIPVVMLQDAADAVPLARALAAGGLPLIEVTFRTAAAQESIRRIAGEVPEAVAGAGTVINAAQARQAVDAGAQFLVSPGFLPEVASAASELGVPLYPGVATGTEIMQALAAGLTTLKLFPAETVGGVKAVKALSAPFPQVQFIPTGGVSLSNLADYLSQPAILAVGGTWMVGKELIAAKDWAKITELASAAVAKAKEVRP
ncbi:MAG: bifunctional 4-hydroxy-2-oxoglutarate aldolase/2-dehydro-3-deoxy-phosphogluconate aldolase [Propionibacteriaceae bacterium]|jgi:2-dehydro-3-deoxyphosphogluconate aldolase/(4S)-4-hydroxy-2-oxoglutarate aldolase|nr:bifunctional 4-hydroxy-2-oxoglutarate aldolase/2-dehydro-3-deoxy-phosphogluconate aldolase [Propionibacteriaceae bacterium]